MNEGAIGYGRIKAMPIKLERQLSPMKVKTAKTGMYADGGCLYLQVTPTKDGKRFNRSWIFRYRVNGRLRDMGLGPTDTLSLAEARERAREQRQKRLDGIDPIDHRRALVAPAVNLVTFDQAAAEVIKAKEDTWTSAVHAAQWRETVKVYCSPFVGSKSVRDIGTADVTKILDAIWKEKPETANRLRGRIEAILNWAKARGLRDGENPARWRGHLDHIYPAVAAAKEAKRARTGSNAHYAALPYDQIGPFMAALRATKGADARGLEFAILTAARTNEVMGARWSEIDEAAKTWTVPGMRMKGGKEHRVPLSDRALAVIKTQAANRNGEHIFGDDGRQLSPTAFTKLLGRMKHGDVTPHGFRSTFRDWAAEQTNFPREIAEAALAHALRDRTEAAYQRGDLLEKRRKLMDAWAACANRSPSTGKVLSMRPTS
jgi:integrase